MYSELECHRLCITSPLCLPPPPLQCLTAFCKEAASTGGLPDWCVGRSGWSGATGETFLELAPTIHAFMLPKANLLVLHAILCCTLPRVLFDTNENENVLMSHMSSSFARQQAKIHTQSVLADRLHTHDTGLGNQKRYLTWPFPSWKQVLITQVSNAWTWCWSYQQFDLTPPHRYILPLFFGYLHLTQKWPLGSFQDGKLTPADWCSCFWV